MTAISTRTLADTIRVLAMDAVQKANSGHPGMPMGMADVATVLFKDFLKFNPAEPRWADRDRFILSAGHGSMLLYALLYLTGYADMTLEEIKNFRQLGAKTAGHPEYGHAEGIETTTGPLGQGLANAVGFALAERLLNARFGDALVDHYTYVIAGDGCLMEGISQEAISLAGHLQLGKLIVLFDDNQISIDGPTSLSTSEDHLKRFMACGWDVQAIDGHDHAAIHAAIARARISATPSLIACRTTIAYGAPTKAGTNGAHGSPLGDEEIARTRQQLGWPHAPFEIPAEILNQWRAIGEQHRNTCQEWQQRAASKPEFAAMFDTKLPVNLTRIVNEFKQKISTEKPKWATRQSSGETLEALIPAIPQLIGGSADLTGSNNTKTKELKPIKPGDFSGRYIYYGIREHGMAAAMNGMALHGGVIPYSGTFLVFSDYCRPSIRLSALMGQRVVYVMTHDSIGLGEDGPTHQPVEHLAALRAIPNLHVFRPADTVETAEAWELALRHENGPSMLVLSRQALPTVRTQHTDENLSRKGAYILAEAEGALQATLFASGSEVEIALQAREQLQAQGMGTRVVSMVCTSLFDAQPIDYFTSLVCNNSIKVAIEAALGFGWEKYIGPHGIFVGMEGFGASGPAKELYQKFGITAEQVVSKVLARQSVAKSA